MLYIGASCRVLLYYVYAIIYIILYYTNYNNICIYAREQIIFTMKYFKFI